MALIIRLSCDRCEGESLTVTVGTATDARVEAFKHGWYYGAVVSSRTPSTPFEAVDLCPVCMGKNLDYYSEEPF